MKISRKNTIVGMPGMKLHAVPVTNVMDYSVKALMKVSISYVEFL